MSDPTTVIIALAVLLAAAVGGLIWTAVQNASLRDEKRRAEKLWASETDKNRELLGRLRDGKQRRAELDAEVERLQGELAKLNDVIKAHDDAVKDIEEDLREDERRADNVDGWDDITFADVSGDKST